MLVRVNLHCNEDVLKIFLASSDTTFLPAVGIAAPIHRKEHEDDQNGDQQFDHGKGAGMAGVDWTRSELSQPEGEVRWNA